MTLFKFSYSKSAVYRAITALKEFDKTYDSELELFPVDNLPPRSSIQHQNISSFFSKIYFFNFENFLKTSALS